MITVRDCQLARSRQPTCACVLRLQVLQDDVTLPPSGFVSELCRDFLAQCLQRDPAKRPAATALLSHPWVAQAAATNLKGLMKKTMFDPENRSAQHSTRWHQQQLQSTELM